MLDTPEEVSALDAKLLVLGRSLRNGQLEHTHPSYWFGLAHGARQAISCGYKKVSAVELGVYHGAGLLELCRAAVVIQRMFDIDVEVYGFDNASGLPPPKDVRDHPEMWRNGDFIMSDESALRAALPPNAHLIIGDVGDTVGTLAQSVKEAPLAFVSVDLDFYSSTKRAMKIFDFAPTSYVPALPIYFDDVKTRIVYNEWCGEALAIKEFNQDNEKRKIAEVSSEHLHVVNLYAMHVFDHPIRTGEQRPVINFDYQPF